jgi:hypothetical protein
MHGIFNGHLRSALHEPASLILLIFPALKIFVSLIATNIERANVVLCEHQKTISPVALRNN